jgi:hypothetical protein
MPPPPDYRANSMKSMGDRHHMAGYHGNQTMPHGRSYQGPGYKMSQDVRRRSAADVYMHADVYVKGNVHPQMLGPPVSEHPTSDRKSHSGLVFMHKRSNSFSQRQPQDSPAYVTPAQPPPTYDRNIYERVGDVVASPGFQSNCHKSGVELRRAPSSQSISSTGSGSVRSGDYRTRRASSKENMAYQNSSHPHPLRMQEIHYRQGSNDSASHYRGDFGNHGSLTGNYQSPDSGDSGFVGSEMTTSDQLPIYTEIQRSGYQRPGFTRAQTVPAEVWPERTDNSRIPREFAHRTAVLAHAVSMFV